jgi:hypothetical protein
MHIKIIKETFLDLRGHEEIVGPFIEITVKKYIIKVDDISIPVPTKLAGIFHRFSETQIGNLVNFRGKIWDDTFTNY